MQRRTVYSLAAATFLTPSLPLGAAAQETIKIGFHAPLTGFAAADGKSAKQGAELAVSQANAAGGINGKKIELVVYDDEAKPENAIPVANKLIGQDKVALTVSGSYSGPTRAAAAVFQRAGMPYISAYAIHPDITRAGHFVFRTGMMGEVQGRAGAKLMGDILKKQRVVIVAVNNDFGQALTAGFKEAAPKFKLQILKEYNFGMPDRQFRSAGGSSQGRQSGGHLRARLLFQRRTAGGPTARRRCGSTHHRTGRLRQSALYRDRRKSVGGRYRDHIA
jgi:branched-chain amino acid transport system substrate-binding protein